ncbi:hypothetical protein [Gemmatimonas phototrophica]|uniref:Uncharacterized protein n=1 Tax=Gemmatimonas phototrophica TaxID=1379270 RepID=A0A143BLW8_9BACT|nr:hypothetical protein [Gemmatimonas phototrophica]AMW06046.1 hypothetical protein GEMMAAP_17145 [Gemmatimonas phototrophica]
MRLTAFFVVVSLAALLGLSTWVESLIEAILIFAVFSLLLVHRPLLTVLGRAPRALRLAALTMAGLWSWSQLHEVVIDSYPFISWRMYGEAPKYQDYSGYRLVGERCTGETIVLPPSSRATGRRPVLSLAVRRAYEESQNASGNPARARQRMDKLLSAILTQWNSNRPTLELCALLLQQTSINVGERAGTTPERYTTVRRYDAR